MGGCLALIEYTKLTNANAVLHRQLQITTANDSAYKDSTTVQIKSKDGLLVSNQRDLVQKTVMLDSLQTALAKSQKLVPVLSDSVHVLTRAISRVDTLKPIIQQHMFVYDDSIKGPPIDGAFHMEIPFSDSSALKSVVMKWDLNTSPFTAVVNVGCPTNPNLPPVLTATTPDWVTMQLSRGYIDPKLCNTLTPMQSPLTLKTIAEVAAPSVLIGILLHVLVK